MVIEQFNLPCGQSFHLQSLPFPISALSCLTVVERLWLSRISWTSTPTRSITIHANTETDDGPTLYWIALPLIANLFNDDYPSNIWDCCCLCWLSPVACSSFYCGQHSVLGPVTDLFVYQSFSLFVSPSSSHVCLFVHPSAPVLGQHQSDTAWVDDKVFRRVPMRSVGRGAQLRFRASRREDDHCP